MRMKNLQDAGIDNVFFLSAVLHQQRKSDVMTYFGLTACSAVYYQVTESKQWPE
jgi:hypothetical protein